MRTTWKQTSAALGAFVAAVLGFVSTFATFGTPAFGDSRSDDETASREAFVTASKNEPQPTVFLYLANCADENARRIYVEYNKAIWAALTESAGVDALERFRKEEYEREAEKRAEAKEAAAREHDEAFAKIEPELKSKTPEEKDAFLRDFYKEKFGVRHFGTKKLGLDEWRRWGISSGTARYVRRLWPLEAPQRARLRVAQECWRLIENEIWPELNVDWENLNLDGARFDFRPEVDYSLDAPFGFEKFGGWRRGIPATLEQLSRTKSWRDKTLRDAEFYRVLTDASFAGWTFENCRFLANDLGQGAAFDATANAPGGRETRQPGDLWQAARAENGEKPEDAANAANVKSDGNVGYVGCDFADATFRNVYFDRSATIAFEQFAATRSFKEDEIDVAFAFPLDGWDFAGKNVDALRTEAPVATEVASNETADGAAKNATEEPTADESERVVYLYLKDAQSESGQALRRAWAEKVAAAKAENGTILEPSAAFAQERGESVRNERLWERVFNGTVETLKTAKIDVDWENLNLDGVHFSDEPRRYVYLSGATEKTEPYGAVECPLFVDDMGTSEIEYAFRATLADLRRTVNWREKRLSDSAFLGVCLDESFAGWTLTKCAFAASKSRKRWPDGCKRADFTDATLDRCSFGQDAAITFEQFASTRSYREDKINGAFHFELNGWDFAGKNVGDLNRSRGGYPPSVSYCVDFATELKKSKLDGARFEPSSKNYPKNLPKRVWLSSRACKEKDLAGATFPATLGDGDFSGFDLTGATMFGVDAKLDGATIRGLRVVSSGRSARRDRSYEVDRIEYKRQNEYGKITKDAICATKSWRDKDLRDVEFNWFYDLTGVDFSGCDLRGATFRFADALGEKLEKTPFFENVDFTDAKIDGCKFYVFAKDGERSWPTLEQIMSTETWKSGDLERLKTCVLPDEAQKIVDRRLFEASPEFAAKDFSGKEIEFRDMTGWDLSGLNLTGCKIKTHSLYNANLTGAILDGATLSQMSETSFPITTGRLRDLPLLTFEQLIATDNYRRKSFRGVRVGEGAVPGRNFSFAGLDLTNATFYSRFGGFDVKRLATFDFTDAEIEGSTMIPWLTKAQIVSTKTFKEGRIDFENFNTYVADGDEKFADELRAEYERLQAGKAKNAKDAENAEESAENGDDAKKSASETRTFYLDVEPPRKSESIDGAASEPDWDALSLDGATISDEPFETIVDEDSPGFPATFEELRRTKTWREKTARRVRFNCSFDDESFAGWTFERCEFGERRSDGKRCRIDGCDFTDATFDDVYFGVSSITFEQFAASRTYKEDKIVAEFAFSLADWDFAGKNVSNIEAPSWDGAKLDGARCDEPRSAGFSDLTRTRNDGPNRWRDAAPRWAKVVPKTPWQTSNAFKNKDLSRQFFWPSLNGGDFSGFDLTDALVLDAPGTNFKLDGATIRGLEILASEADRYKPFKDAIPAEAIYRTKSWKDKDLRNVCFNRYFDLTGADFSGCDLRGAFFGTALKNVDFTGADLRGATFRGAPLVGNCFKDAIFDATTQGIAWEWLEEWRKDDGGSSDKVAARIRLGGVGFVWQDDGYVPTQTRRVATKVGVRELPNFWTEATYDRAKEYWQGTKAFKNKDLSGTFLPSSINGGDLSGFDLTGAVVRRVLEKPFDFRDATIRGLWIVDAGGENGDARTRYLSQRNAGMTLPSPEVWGAIKFEEVAATKSWKIKDLREVWFNEYFDLRDADFSDCDLRGAIFETSLDGADFVGADLRGAKFSERGFTDAVDDKTLKNKLLWEDGADFSGADLRGADFRNAEAAARRSNFKGAKIDETTLGLPEGSVEKENAQQEGRQQVKSSAKRAVAKLERDTASANEPFGKGRVVTRLGERSATFVSNDLTTVATDRRWRDSEAFKNKMLSETCFATSLNGGDFSGFDLTGAVARRVLGKPFDLRGATIRGLWIVDAEAENAEIRRGEKNEKGETATSDARAAIKANDLIATKSWSVKDLRDVWFNAFFDLRGADFLLVDLRGAVFETSLEGAYFLDAKIDGCKFSRRAFGADVDAVISALSQTETWKDLERMKTVEFSPLIRERVERRLGGETKRPAVESDWGDADWEDEDEGANGDKEKSWNEPKGDFSTFFFTCKKPKFEVRRPVSVYPVLSDEYWRTSNYFKEKNLRSVGFDATLGDGDFSGFDLTGAVILDGVYENFCVDGATIRGLWILGEEKPENKIWLGSISPDELRSTQSWKIKDLRGVCFNAFFDLRGVDFAGRDLSETVWTAALRGVKFSGCDLNGAFFAVGFDADADVFADAEIENCVFAAKKPSFEQLTQTRTFRDGRLDYDAFDDAERLRAEFERLQASK